MTALAVAAAPRHSAPVPHRFGWRLTVLTVVAVAAGLRLFHIQTAYEIFVDEVSYAKLSASVAAGRGLMLNGGPFDLHPPGMFVLFGGMLRVLGAALDNPVALISMLRPVEAVIGAVTCGLVVVLVSRSAPRPIAVGCGLLLALDPFVIRFDSRVMLEAPTMALSVLAMLLVTRVLAADGRRSVQRRRSVQTRRAVQAGLVLGLALLFKETFAAVTVVPVLLAAVLLPTHRRALLRVLAVSAAVYLAYVAAVVAVGRGGHWAAQKFSGVLRLFGVVQETGFNRPGSSSFLARITGLLTTYAVTYTIIGVASLLAAAAAVEHLRARRTGGTPPRPAVLLLICWQLGAVAYLSYAVLLGALEEQVFYLALAPSVTVLGLAAARWWSSTARSSRRTWWRVLAVLIVGLMLAANGNTWWRVHSVRDDAYRQFLAWASTSLTPTDRVAVTEETAQFITLGVVLGQWATPAALAANDANYVVVVQSLVDQGLGLATPSLVSWLDQHGTVVFEADTPTAGSLRVYQLAPS